MERRACAEFHAALRRWCKLVGKNSPNPDKKIWNDDWNNLSPSLGLSWSLPWLGKDKNRPPRRLWRNLSWESHVWHAASRRSGFYPDRAGRLDKHRHLLHAFAFVSLANISFAYPASIRTHFSRWLLTGREMTSCRARRMIAVVRTFRTSTSKIQRELPANSTLSIAYVGTKGTALWNAVPINGVHIFNNGFPGSVQHHAFRGQCPAV
jgi:hypothetical protein